MGNAADLNLGMIGNCAHGALIDQRGRIVWCCHSRFDGDPVFNELLGGGGAFSIELDDFASAEQEYRPNTAILETKLYDSHGGGVKIIDFAPRFHARGRMFRPLTIVRRLLPISGAPRIRIRLRPTYSWGATSPQITHGSNHIRYVADSFALRLTTNAPIDYVLKETPFLLDRPISLILGPDDTLSGGPEETARDFDESTDDYWRSWAQRLSLPLEWQDAVIRAAITLKMCVFEETGAIIAALTTSIPEAPNSGRNWDYRFCWLRDAFFVVRALNSLSAVGTMERYLRWIDNVVSGADGHLQPVYGVGLEADLIESEAPSLPGYRGMGPVRRGNQAHEHNQHDVYGNVILATAQSFFDRRLFNISGADSFWRLEGIGEHAFRLYDQPDAGMWELRSRARIHTTSSLMCWAACDRLGKIARSLGLSEREQFWSDRAQVIRERILTEAWSEKRRAFVDSFGGKDLDAGVLLMAEVGFIDSADPRFIATVERLEEVLGDGPHMRRYESPDDFGAPETAFNICAFWRIDALNRIGRGGQAREIFDAVLSCRNHLGLLSEDIDPKTGELWGNFPQTYSMVGVINGATRLSKAWDTML